MLYFDMERNVRVMKKMAKIVLILLLVAGVAVGGILYALQPLSVETVRLEDGPVSLTFTEQGTYAYQRSFTVYPLVSGEILETRVEKGDSVKAGDVLAVVSASDYEDQIAQLEKTIDAYNGQISNLWLQEQQRKDELSGSLENLQGQMTSLEAEMAKNKATSGSLEGQLAIQQDIIWFNSSQMRRAQEDLRDARDYGDDAEIRQARQAYTAAMNTLSQSELLLEQMKNGDVPQDIYEGQRQSLQAQMDTVGSQMGKSYSGGMHQMYTAQIAAAELNIEQLREKTGHAEVRAVVDGVVTSFPAGDQNLLGLQSPAAVVESQPAIEVFVPVREIGGVAVGDSVTLILDRREGKEELPGAVLDMKDTAEVRLSALGVEERKVKVLVQPEGGALQIGYDVDVRFTSASWDSALTVPKTAVYTKGEEDFVWVLRDGVLEERPIVKGQETRDAYLVEDGLSPGDEVVLDANDETLSAGKKAAGK